MKKNVQKKFFSIFVLTAFCALCVCAAILLCAPTQIAFADDGARYLMAPVGNLTGNEYAGSSTIKLWYSNVSFYIPESYYVEWLSDEPQVLDLYSVRYAGMDNTFFMQIAADEQKPATQSIVFDDDVLPYPDTRLNVPDGTTVVVNNQEFDNSATIKLLGYNDDATKVFVSATKDGTTRFGMVDKTSFADFNVPYHPISQAQRDAILSKPEPNPDNGDIIPNTSVALRVIIIIGIAIPGVLIVILLFKPSKHDVRTSKKVMRNQRRKEEFDYDDARSYRRPDDYDDFRYPSDRRNYDRYRDERYRDERYRDERDYDRRDYDPRDDYRR